MTSKHNRIKALKAEIERLETEVNEAEASLVSIGDQPPPGSVIQWTAEFSPGSAAYTYVGVRVGDIWYTTDSIGGPTYTWEKLEEWLNNRYSFSLIHMVPDYNVLEAIEKLPKQDLVSQ